MYVYRPHEWHVQKCGGRSKIMTVNVHKLLLAVLASENEKQKVSLMKIQTGVC